jgi:hypothetical protein
MLSYRVLLEGVRDNRLAKCDGSYSLPQQAGSGAARTTGTSTLSLAFVVAALLVLSWH